MESTEVIRENLAETLGMEPWWQGLPEEVARALRTGFYGSQTADVQMQGQGKPEGETSQKLGKG